MIHQMKQTERQLTFNSLPWIEKYRPSKMKNVKADEQIRIQVEKMISCKDIPNIILEGPPGVGKTSTIKCIAREIYGKYYVDMVLEMNASDDRGIKIQDSIENFRRSYVHIDKNDKKSTPVFKMVILDEADNMTDKAKHIISGFIKNCVNDLRFAFTCNTKNNIIPSIQSGCHIIKYPPLNDQIVRTRLFEICECENIVTEKTSNKEKKTIMNGLEAIAQITNGDMRSAINTMQLTYNRFGSLTLDNVYKINDKPHPEKSRNIIDMCCDNNLAKAIELVIELRKKGFSGTDITMGLRLALRIDICAHIPEQLKIDFWRCISYSSYNISKGLDASILQIVACVADMCKSATQYNQSMKITDPTNPTNSQFIKSSVIKTKKC
jgi:replication factor C subunit 2/4